MCWLIAIFFSYWHLDNWVVIMAQRSCVIFLFSQYAIDPLMKNKNTLRVPWYLLGVDSANIGLFWLDMHLGAASSRRQLHNLQEFVSFLAVLCQSIYLFDFPAVIDIDCIHVFLLVTITGYYESCYNVNFWPRFLSNLYNGVL